MIRLSQKKNSCKQTYITTAFDIVLLPTSDFYTFCLLTFSHRSSRCSAPMRWKLELKWKIWWTHWHACLRVCIICDFNSFRLFKSGSVERTVPAGISDVSIINTGNFKWVVCDVFHVLAQLIYMWLGGIQFKHTVFLFLRLNSRKLTLYVTIISRAICALPT